VWNNIIFVPGSLMHYCLKDNKWWNCDSSSIDAFNNCNHQVVKALRDGRIDATRITGENSTTGAGGSNLEAPGVVEANNGRVEAVQEVDDEKVQQDSGPTYEAEDVGGRDSRDKEHAKAAGGDERGTMQLARDAELCDKSCETALQSPLYWAPYIHFGV
jgi:hypothetical protein